MKSFATFAALADPTRRAILDRLFATPCSVAELAAPFAMSRPAVSQHLRILRAAGLVVPEKAGRKSIYRVEARPLAEVRDWVSKYFELRDPAGHLWRVRGKQRRH
jgi:DNA-binding transcriptional ArsR family regulator